LRSSGTWSVIRRISATTMPGDAPASGGRPVLKWALSLLGAAIAVRVAFALLAQIEPELIGLAVVASLGSSPNRVQRYRHNRW